MLAARSCFALAALGLAFLAFGATAFAGNPAPSPIERTFTGLLNEERSQRGLAPVEISPALTEISDDYIAENEAAGSFDHARDEPYTDRAFAAGCSKWLGPVLASGYPTARDTLDAWLSSSGHRAVLLDPEITHVGPGFGPDQRLMYGMPCEPTAQNTSGDFGDPNAGESIVAPGDPGDPGGPVDPAATVVEVVSTKARRLIAQVRVTVTGGAAAVRLIAERKGRTVRGEPQFLAVGAKAQRLKLALPRKGRWDLTLAVGDEERALGSVRARP